MVKDRNFKVFRIVLSSITLVVAVVSFLFHILITCDLKSFAMLRMDILRFAIDIVPIVALFVFSLLEPILENANKRIYLLSVFALYIIQAVILLVLGIPNAYAESLIPLDSIAFGTWSFMCLLIPIAHKNLVKLYCVGMTFLLSINFVYLCVVPGADLSIVLVLLYVVNILEHITIWFFADLLTKDNEIEFVYTLLTYIVMPIFGKEDEDEELDCEDDFNLAVEYHKVLVFCMNSDNKDFIECHEFFNSLSKNEFYTNGEYYPQQMYVYNINKLKNIIDDINKEKDGFISSEFTKILDKLIKEMDKFSFKIDIAMLSKIMLNDNLMFIAEAADRFEETMR